MTFNSFNGWLKFNINKNGCEIQSLYILNKTEKLILNIKKKLVIIDFKLIKYHILCISSSIL